MNERSATPYRADIDGLRAVAVLAVIAHHAGWPWARGGYVGVDVFFVISGFLITGILLREHANGRFSLARFYERRARRILPALLVVLGATLLVSTAIMFDADRRIVARTAVGVLAFAANIIFWGGVDFGNTGTLNYFQRRIHEQPLAHTWSLGVEEQYYLFFPLLLMAILRWRRETARRTLVAVALASFGACALITARDQASAFYLLPSRIWELLVGGLVAWHGVAPGLSRPRSAALAATGLVLVLAPIAVFTEHSPFPGMHAAAPVLGTALVIRYAAGTYVSSLLAWPPLVFIGLISYSAYLWHQPLFASARYLELSAPLSLGVTLAGVAATLAMAAATWWWVERPFRDRRRVGPRALAWSCGAATLTIGAAAAAWAFDGDTGRRTPIPSSAVGQAALSLFSDCRFSQPTARLGLGCLLDPSSDEPASFLVIGDSHADAIYPAFAKFSRESGRQGRLVYELSCPSVIDVTGAPAGHERCRQMQQAALDLAARGDVSDVFIVARFTNYNPVEAFADRFAATVAAYAERGVGLHVVAQVPEQPRFNLKRYARAAFLHQFGLADAASIIAESASRAEHDAQHARQQSVFDRYRDDARVTIIDLTSAYCDNTWCPAGTASQSYYIDDDHLSAHGALRGSDELARQVRLGNLRGE